MNGSFSAVRGVAEGAALVVVSALMAGATPRVRRTSDQYYVATKPAGRPSLLASVPLTSSARLDLDDVVAAPGPRSISNR
jgi:hypothetical protein